MGIAINPSMTVGELGRAEGGAVRGRATAAVGGLKIPVGVERPLTTDPTSLRVCAGSLGLKAGGAETVGGVPATAASGGVPVI